MKPHISQIIRLIPALLLSVGCTMQGPSDPVWQSLDRSNLPTPDVVLNIPGLSPCTTTPDTTLHLNSSDPVTIIVHGCKGSAARFRSLAQVFAFQGQQTVCFNYNDRNSLMESSAELIEALQSLTAKINTPEITVIGHSQGGLISRKALVRDRDIQFSAGDTSLRLVTISTPYAGISAADHCSSTIARFVTLGLAVPLCKLISGDKWYEITTPSTFIQEPGELLDQVATHLKIVTDETGSCRRYENNICVEDDFVFSLDEQYFEQIDGSLRTENVEVLAGHTEIVGDHDIPPEKLILLLQAKGIMRSTLPERKDMLAELLARLY